MQIKKRNGWSWQITILEIAHSIAYYYATIWSNPAKLCSGMYLVELHGWAQLGGYHMGLLGSNGAIRIQ
jgi:hypothetical protein